MSSCRATNAKIEALLARASDPEQAARERLSSIESWVLRRVAADQTVSVEEWRMGQRALSRLLDLAEAKEPTT